jgi:hypothetical protein
VTTSPREDAGSGRSVVFIVWSDLVRAALGEADRVQAEEVAIGGLHVGVRLDERVPLADERSQLIRGEVHAVEVGQAVGALDLLDAELELSVSIILSVRLEVTEGGLKHAAHEAILRQLRSLETSKHDTQSEDKILLSPRPDTSTNLCKHTPATRRLRLKEQRDAIL